MIGIDSAYSFGDNRFSGFEPEEVIKDSYKAPIFGIFMGGVGLLAGVTLKISILATGAFFALGFGLAASVNVGLRYLAAKEVIGWKTYFLGSAAAFILIPTVAAVALVATGVFTAPVLIPTIALSLLTGGVLLTLAFIDGSDNMS